MIVIDGNETAFCVNNFTNLEELLVKVLEEDSFDDRIVTNVYLNKESFSELYPHQAEDIPAEEIESVEIQTMSLPEMAKNIITQLHKVIMLMDHGSLSIARLYRRGDDAEALELYQDLLDVTRDFIRMVAGLRDEFGMANNVLLKENLDEISTLFSEMIEVSEEEDWVLLADLLEYEFAPGVKKWQGVIASLLSDIDKQEAA